MRQTTMLKPSEVVRTWYVVDATDATLGRLSTKVATVLRGKHKPTYTPNVEDFWRPGFQEILLFTFTVAKWFTC